MTQTLDYYPYGSQRIATGSFSEQRRFIGEEYDPDTAFSYLNARYYEGSRGQFMSQDPVFIDLGVDRRTKALLADPQLQNAYAYSRNNPLFYKDPEGDLAIEATLIAIALSAGAGFFAGGGADYTRQVIGNMNNSGINGFRDVFTRVNGDTVRSLALYGAGVGAFAPFGITAPAVAAGSLSLYSGYRNDWENERQ